VAAPSVIELNFSRSTLKKGTTMENIRKYQVNQVLGHDFGEKKLTMTINISTTEYPIGIVINEAQALDLVKEVLTMNTRVRNEAIKLIEATHIKRA
jgi:hypothetical protein